MASDPLSGSPWSAQQTVAGFAQSSPNPILMEFAGSEMRRRGSLRVLDVGCGAGRNAVPLARLGAHVLGVDLSWPMITAARDRARDEEVADRLHLALAPMDAIPAPDHSVDLVVAHGIWNLAHSAAEFRRAVAEAARVGVADAAVFVFTFSRNTLPAHVEPVRGEPFVFTQFMDEPQCFLTEEQLLDELRAGGFAPDDQVPLTELNRPRPGALQPARGPVIYQGVFRRK